MADTERFETYFASATLLKVVVALLATVADVLAFDHEHHHLAQVGGVVADAL
jgi:hypothetical protein